MSGAHLDRGAYLDRAVAPYEDVGNRNCERMFRHREALQGLSAQRARAPVYAAQQPQQPQQPWRGLPQESAQDVAATCRFCLRADSMTENQGRVFCRDCNVAALTPRVPEMH
jgi:hypothetical protein